jgi:hypothetical protein
MPVGPAVFNSPAGSGSVTEAQGLLYFKDCHKKKKEVTKVAVGNKRQQQALHCLLSFRAFWQGFVGGRPAG